MTDPLDTPLPGDHWRFTHGGFEWEVEIDRVNLDGAVIHGRLLEDHPAGAILGRKGDLIMVPTTSVRAGERTRSFNDGR